MRGVSGTTNMKNQQYVNLEGLFKVILQRLRGLSKLQQIKTQRKMKFLINQDIEIIIDKEGENIRD